MTLNPLQAIRARVGAMPTALLVWLALGVASAHAAQAKDTIGDCRVGSYQLSDGSDVDIGPTDGPQLRWRRKDGTTGALTETADGRWTSTLGWTERPDGKQVSFSDCSKGDIRFDGSEGKRIAFDVTE